jgi:hypothetical protein
MYKISIHNLDKNKRFVVTSWYSSLYNVLKVQLFYDVTPCHWASSFRRFERSYCFHLQGNSRIRRIILAAQLDAFLDCFTVKMKTLRYFETSTTARQTTQHIPQHLNLQQPHFDDRVSAEHGIFMCQSSPLSVFKTWDIPEASTNTQSTSI